MSAKCIVACHFEPVTEEQVPVIDPSVLEGMGTEIQFLEDVWRDYHQEAISVGLTAAEAVAYATTMTR